MLALITCGPASAPIDRVRRITNFSTGEIGAALAGAFRREGFDVVCFRGEGASFPMPAECEVRPFATNESLAAGLQGLAAAPDVVLHAAALSDFEVEGIEGADGTHKLSSRSGTIRLTLRPARKLLPELRGWFPNARIIGWKYELDGTGDQAIGRAAAQIAAARTDACVVNGAAYGAGFGLLAAAGQLEHFPDKAALAAALARREKDFSDGPHPVRVRA